MENRKIVGFELINKIEINPDIAPIEEGKFNDIASAVMDVVRDDIFAMGHFCGSSVAKPIFEETEV